MAGASPLTEKFLDFLTMKLSALYQQTISGRIKTWLISDCRERRFMAPTNMRECLGRTGSMSICSSTH